MNRNTLKLLDDKRKWIILFLVTYLAAFYWLPSQIPLYYSQALPEDRLASRYELLIIPGALLVFYWLTEFFLGRLALKNQHMLNLIQYFKIGMSICAYILFAKIIILMF